MTPETESRNGKSGERTAVVVSAHRMYPTLERCLGGFQALVADPADLIFVRNGPSSELSHLVAERFPGCTQVSLGENAYFCGGYNAGIRLALERNLYDFVLIANADTEVINPSFVHSLREAAKRWPRAAFLGPLVYLDHAGMLQITCLRYPSVLRDAAIWFPWRLARGVLPTQPDHECEVEFLNGVCVLCRVAALTDIGLMDETFGGYVEDADWSWRAQAKGWSSVFSPVPSIIHHEAPEGYEHYSLKSFLLKRNTVFWFLKVGRRHSATLYARASLCLARLRLLGAQPAESDRYRHFLRRLTRAFNGLLAGETPGDWFGPPLGAWE